MYFSYLTPPCEGPLLDWPGDQHEFFFTNLVEDIPILDMLKETRWRGDDDVHGTSEVNRLLFFSDETQ